MLYVIKASAMRWRFARDDDSDARVARLRHKERWHEAA